MNSPIANVCHFLGSVIVLPHLTPIYQSVSWSVPSLGTIKISTDGSFASSRARICGIFRNHENKSLLYFSKHIFVELAIHAKILSIREGFLVAAAFRWP